MKKLKFLMAGAGNIEYGSSNTECRSDEKSRASSFAVGRWLLAVGCLVISDR
jgi:hypothetical protein